MPDTSFALPAAIETMARPPSRTDYLSDRGLRALAATGAVLIIALVAFILWKIGGQALPAIYAYHADFLVSTTWNTQTAEFGVLPQIWGTLYSSLLALLIGGFLGVTLAIFLTEGFLPRSLALVLRTIVEMLAAIPSVVFGLWGIFVVIPVLRPIGEWLYVNAAWIPFFATSPGGPGLMPATVVLSIMILPTITAISQDALNLIPYSTREAAYAMGATRWEAVSKVFLPTAAGGIFASMVLGFGRALGETMALAMLIGHSNQISLALFAPADTLASLLASHFPEAGPVEVKALMYAALVLLAITLLVNVAGTWVLETMRTRISGKS